MKSDAMRRVSSLVSGRAAPAGDSFPLISTSGGFPGEKNKSLTFADVLSMAASKSLVEIRAGAGAAAAALPAAPAPADGFGDGEAAGVGTFGIGFVGVDMMGRLFPLSLSSSCSRSCYVCFRYRCFHYLRILSIFDSLIRGYFEQKGRSC